MGSSARENMPWLEKHAGYASEELSLLEGCIAYFFEEFAGHVPAVDAPHRVDEAISYSEPGDFVGRFATLPAFRGIEKGGRVDVYAQVNPQYLTASGLCVLDRAVRAHDGGDVPNTI